MTDDKTTTERLPELERTDPWATEPEKMAHVGRQTRESKGPQPSITCVCGHSLPLRFTYLCLYCNLRLCKKCAEQHFGQSADEYKAERELGRIAQGLGLDAVSLPMAKAALSVAMARNPQHYGIGPPLEPVDYVITTSSEGQD